MPTRDAAPIGAPCWVDLMTSDIERSRAFYCQLFGWTAEEPAEEFGGYLNFTKNGVPVAGCMASQPGSGMPDAWSVYLAADDTRKTLDAATANGGPGPRRHHGTRVPASPVSISVTAAAGCPWRSPPGHKRQNVSTKGPVISGMGGTKASDVVALSQPDVPSVIGRPATEIS
jgi:predicted enzyme related to lactoylglutathione lyase